MSTNESFPPPPLERAVLPPTAYSHPVTRLFSGDYQSVYNLIRAAEHHAIMQYTRALATAPREERKQDLISARVAGFYLIELYSRRDVLGIGAAREIVRQVIEPPAELGQDSNQMVFEVGSMLRNHLMLFCVHPIRFCLPFFACSPSLQVRAVRSDRPLSRQPSPPSFDTTEDMIYDCLESSTTNYDTSRNKTLAREGFRCPITGIFSASWIRHIDELRRHPEAPTYGSGDVICCHIFDESTLQAIDSFTPSEPKANQTKQRRHTASRTTLLTAFGLKHLVDNLLSRDGMHHLSNLIALNQHLRTAFNGLNLWFDATGQPNQYQVRTADPYIREGPKFFLGCVTFSVQSDKYGPDELPLPSPELLALHAASAVVAHMSGAARYYDEVDRDREDMTVLAFDGSSAPLLHTLLAQASLLTGIV